MKIAGITIAVIALLAGGVTWYGWSRTTPLADPGKGKTLDIRIQPGETLAGVAKKLEEEGIIKEARALRWWASWTNWNLLQHGKHTVSSELSVSQMLEELAKPGGVDTTTFTIPEGRTIYDVAEILAQAGFAPSTDDALKTLQDPKVIQRRLGDHGIDPLPDSLEGYLFPAGYEVPVNVSIEEVVKQIVDTFWSRMPANAELELARLELSIHEWVTLASLAEAESREPSERPVIASLYYSRFKIHHMPLQCDPTVKYGLIRAGLWKGEYRNSLARKPDGHIDWDSFNDPYNTYHSQNTGLPPGPIGNPGEDALRGALSAERTEIRYMYADPERWGTFRHCFSKTDADHARCISGARNPDSDGVLD